MGLVTLADGTQHNLTASNADTLAKQQLAIYRSRGVAVDEAATYQAFLEGAGRDTAFAQAGSPGSTSIDFNKLGAVAAQQDLEQEPLVGASNAVIGVLPSPVARSVTDFSNGIVTAGDKARAAAVAAAEGVKGQYDALTKTVGELFSHLPAGLDKLNTTTQMAIVGGTIVVVVAGAAFAIYKFKR